MHSCQSADGMRLCCARYLLFSPVLRSSGRHRNCSNRSAQIYCSPCLVHLLSHLPLMAYQLCHALMEASFFGTACTLTACSAMPTSHRQYTSRTPHLHILLPCHSDGRGSLGCRLTADLQSVEDSLDFWKERLSQSGHGRFLLLSQGPVSFAKSIQAALHRHPGSQSLTATSEMERRVSVMQCMPSCA